ncbi:proline-rich protein 35 [Rhinatrema bivittatum]|uniref:proline-rich protein 35 n=1 Tax=Rhinatrema bivittatum TaxID=194408 RepID=UPI00112BC001|nr:proline-rich protein 35 [Rhinatrema bivittatum]XP_029433109.1 proline-rich protein 35 [Rhinatrema bivittatum]XP_029433110.1 proline-rich protein 35 [Rhinatrema bivittatum]XP_029433112.1 proline-rich protein 35 [Rhinatrema bivittatum]XP_029433113.1 proline-rich protein 35 [Rhinatrema bivittatum]
MSKEEDGNCKLTSVYKHKQRKPKKPHYIPRPWGKPYNYKCFQCPFTCMEKSHLYNHMKYSLCKNSLSLLIESDWPYKNGNLLHPELHLIQAAEASRHHGGPMDKQENYDFIATMDGMVNMKNVPRRDTVDSEKSEEDILSSNQMHKELHQFQEMEEEDVKTTGQPKETDARQKKAKAMGANYHYNDPAEPSVNTLLLGFKNKGDKTCKDSEPDFIITDVFSLQKNVMKSKEPSCVESEVKPKHCKVPKKCLGSNGILMEQWKQLTKKQRKGTTDIVCPGTEANIIPCYPRPAYSDNHEPQGLNLALLGINYPLNPNLFSYLGPTMTNNATAHPHLTQLPFLASTAQLMHPHSAHLQSFQNPERSAFLPRFYYPLLFEHMFGSSEGMTASAKLDIQQQQLEASVPTSHEKSPSETQKAALHKVPVAKTNTLWTTNFQEKPSLDSLIEAPIENEEEKWPTYDKTITEALSQEILSDVFKKSFKERDNLPNSTRTAELPMATCLSNARTLTASLKRKSLFAGELDLLKDHKASEMLAARKISYHTSNMQDSPQLLKSFDQWKQKHKMPSTLETQEKAMYSQSPSSMIATNGQPDCKQSHVHKISRDSEAATMLIWDLSKTLEEYQEVEKKLSDMAKENNSGQKGLKAQLVKIRKELFHIHQTLEKATKAHEGPLDLSVKKSHGGFEKDRNEASKLINGDPRLQCKDHDTNIRLTDADDIMNGDKMPSCLSEPESKTFDFLMKMSQSEDQQPTSKAHQGTFIKTDACPINVSVELRHVMEPYYSHTTKCEADSSVLLCTDRRSNNAAQVHHPLLLPEEEQMNLGDRHHSMSCGGSGPSEAETIRLHSPSNAD